MSLRTAPLAPLTEPPAGTTPTSLLTALGALVAVVALVWAVGSAASSGNGTTAPATAPPAGASTPAPTPTTLDRLNTPVGHHGEYRVQYADLPQQTQAQLDVVRKIIERYPTAADAERAGWRRATTNLKGIATHYLRGGVGGFINVDSTFDVNDPEILLYDGIAPDSPIAGVSYLASGPDPAGFAGKWDVWHRHQAVCFAGGYVIGELDGHAGSLINMTADQCRQQGGTQFPLSNLTMLHVWMKAGFGSTSGVFSHDHPRLS